MGVNHSATRDISALNKATIVDAAEILLAEKDPDSNREDDHYEIALQGGYPRVYPLDRTLQDQRFWSTLFKSINYDL